MRAKKNVYKNEFHRIFQRETITYLDNSKLPMEKRGKLERDAQIMIKMLPKQVEHEKKMKKSNGEKETNLKQTEIKLSKSVEFDYTEREGRFTKASRSIKVGEELLIERAICATLFEQFAKSHCQYCFARYVDSFVDSQ